MSYLELQIQNLSTEASEKIKKQLEDWGELYLGTEEYSLDESQVDNLLGDRSYSGGNLPIEVINEVDNKSAETHQFKIYFNIAARSKVEGLRNFIKESLHYDSVLLEKQEEDWNEEWKKHYNPILITTDMVVIPVWDKENYPPIKFPIYIYPGQGFGTGSHETTALCLELFMKHLSSDNKIQEVMDFGSGSGILAIGARRVFPLSKLVLVDIDQEAHENALINFKENDLSLSGVNFLFPNDSLIDGKKYQLIFANILQNILFEVRDRLIHLLDNNGSLILSGLLIDQLEATIAFYLEVPGLELVEVSTRNDWGAIYFRKKNS